MDRADTDPATRESRPKLTPASDVLKAGKYPPDARRSKMPAPWTANEVAKTLRADE